MQSHDKQRAVLILKLIAAQAEKLASDLESNRLWEGDYQRSVSSLSAQIHQLPEER